MENQKHIEAYQDLFNYLHDEHDLILLQSEMDEIIDLSIKAVAKYNEASEGKETSDELPAGNCNKPHVIKSVCDICGGKGEYYKLIKNGRALVDCDCKKQTVL